MTGRIAAALKRRRDAKAKARRIGEALRGFAQFDADLRGLTVPSEPIERGGLR